MIEDALYTILKSNTALAAILGDRIYPDRLPQKPLLPAIVYNNVGGSPIVQHDGIAKLESTRIQIDAFAKTSRDARLLIDAVRQAVEGYRGSIGGHRIDTIFVFNHGVGDFDDVPEDFRRMTEIEIWHTL